MKNTKTKANRKAKQREIFETVMSTLVLVAMIMLMLVLTLLNEPNGYYVETEQTQPNGNHYVWVEE